MDGYFVNMGSDTPPVGIWVEDGPWGPHWCWFDLTIYSFSNPPPGGWWFWVPAPGYGEEPYLPPVDDNRYWVGGSGNWHDPAHWSDSPSGSGGYGVPNNNQDARIYTAGESAPITITMNADVSCRSISIDHYGEHPLTIMFKGKNVSSEFITINIKVGDIIFDLSGALITTQQWQINGTVVNPEGSTITIKINKNESIAAYFIDSGDGENAYNDLVLDYSGLDAAEIFIRYKNNISFQNITVIPEENIRTHLFVGEY